MSTINDALAAIKERKYADRRLAVFNLEFSQIVDGQIRLTGKVLEKRCWMNCRWNWRVSSLTSPWTSALWQSCGKFNPKILTTATSLVSMHARPSWDSETENELVYGMTVEILEEEDNWVYTRQTLDGYLAWAYKPYLSEQPAYDPTHMVTAPVAVLRQSPIRTHCPQTG